jgi:phosphate transport system protein
LSAVRPGPTRRWRDKRMMEIGELKEKLLIMASHAEAAVNHSVRALLRRDDDLALQTKADDSVIDEWEMAIDEAAVELLARGLERADVRLVTVAMKIAHNLERVGDEATTISRRCLALGLDPQLRQAQDVPRMALLALQMLKGALDAYVNRDPAGARALIPQDAEVDALNRRHRRELAAYMADHPGAVERCLNLMVVFKSLERIADHAKNIAEEVVYLYEGEDIRHAAARAPAYLEISGAGDLAEPSDSCQAKL